MIKMNLIIAICINLVYSTIAWTANSYYSKNYLSSKYSSWGVDPKYTDSSINLEKSWELFKKQKDIIVAVIDTGIQFNHPFLANNIYVPKSTPNSKNFGLDFSGNDLKATFTPYDSHGHGTHVSGIIKSIFPEVKILPLKYYNPQASGQHNLNSTIKALEYAVDLGVDIINYSGGGPESSDIELKILKRAEEKGILIIAAAGNEKSNIDLKKNAYYPASYGLSNIITVGAHNEQNKIIASSNWGEKSVDIAAPGHRIKSAIPGNAAGYMTGTSQATAFVTGVAAMIKSQFPRFTYSQVKNIILTSSLKVGNFKGKILGSGKLDAKRALQVASLAYSKLFPKSRSIAKEKK